LYLLGLKKRYFVLIVCEASVVTSEVIGEDEFLDENPDQDIEEIAHFNAGCPCQTAFEEADLEELAR
jgi:hypothetical protein